MHKNKITTGNACAVERDEDLRSIWEHATVQTYDQWGLGSGLRKHNSDRGRGSVGTRLSSTNRVLFANQIAYFCSHILSEIN